MPTFSYNNNKPITFPECVREMKILPSSYVVLLKSKTKESVDARKNIKRLWNQHASDINVIGREVQL